MDLQAADMDFNLAVMSLDEAPRAESVHGLVNHAMPPKQGGGSSGGSNEQPPKSSGGR